MGFQDYISEIEATAITGISGATLNRFVEAGYLQIESDTDGLRLYSKAALIALFGADKKVPSNAFSDQYPGIPKASPQPQQSNAEPKKADAVKVTEQAADAAVMTPANPAQEAQTTEIPVPLAKQVEKSVIAPENPQLADSGLSAPDSEENEAQENEAQPDSGVEKAEEISKTPESVELSPEMEYELFKLRQIAQMQEKLLDIKDREIKDLKDQRDWLKERVQKFEEKSDRDQILLLSETQTIRKLMLIQESRKSPLQMALEWLGIAKPAPMGSMMIELNGPGAEKNPGATTNGQSK